MAGDQSKASETAGIPVIPGGLSVVSGPMPETLQQRRDFLAVSRGRRIAQPGFVLQAMARQPADAAPPRVGYTCSKKVGNAVARNRAKRRLRALAHAVIRTEGQAGWDYVLIGRRDVTAARPFADLLHALSGALGRIHKDHPQ